MINNIIKSEYNNIDNVDTTFRLYNKFKERGIYSRVYQGWTVDGINGIARAYPIVYLIVRINNEKFYILANRGNIQIRKDRRMIFKNKPSISRINNVYSKMCVVE